MFWMVLVSPPSCIYTKTSLVNQLYQKDNKIHNLSLPLNRGGATPLATLLKTAKLEFFLKRNAFIKTPNQGNFLHPHQLEDFSDAHCSFASAPGASQISAETEHSDG